MHLNPHARPATTHHPNTKSNWFLAYLKPFNMAFRRSGATFAKLFAARFLQIAILQPLLSVYAMSMQTAGEPRI